MSFLPRWAREIRKELDELREVVIHLLDEIQHPGHHPKPPTNTTTQVVIYFTKGATPDMSTIPTPTPGAYAGADNVPFSATLSLADAEGFPTGATPDSPPTWAESSNGTVVTVTPSEDGLSATFAPVAPGTSNVTVSTTVSGAPLTGTGTVTITAGPTATLALTFTAGTAAAPTAPTAPSDPTLPS